MSGSMYIGDKQLIVTGDRVLVSPPTAGMRTDSGLYLPDSAQDSRKVSGGWVEAVGPGYPLAPGYDQSDSEPWKPVKASEVRFMPLQVEKGDFVLYVLNSSFEIQLEGSKYYVVPNHSILAILRNTLDINNPGD